jgi:phosphoadenosine phosphosulfate reductase
MNREFQRVCQLAERLSAEDVLHWAFEAYGQQIEIASGFGAEGVVLIDIAARVQPTFRIFTLDTEFLFPETYRLMESMERRYGISIERIRPELSSETQEQFHGPALWSRNPDLCCNIRKVQPLEKKLSQLSAWVTSIRRDQTAARSAAGKVEWDEKFGLVKVNPLADWTAGQIWQYIRAHDVPYNPLHDQHYPSIGCTHCTRSVQAGEDPRAGRWAGFNKTECGLHSRPVRIQAAGNAT